MKGKLLKVFNNDLNGKVDERVVIFFAAFNYIKYSNKYGIFVFSDGMNSGKILFGSIHIKEKSLVVFSLKNEQEKIIDAFLTEYKTNNFQEFELIDISKLDKIELVGYNEKEYKELVNLYNISIPREEKPVKKEDKKSGIYSIIITFLVLITGAFGLYWFFHPRMFNPLILNCEMTGLDNRIIVNYKKNKIVTFNGRDRIKEIKSTDTYSFKNENKYYDFKSESKHYLYFDNIDDFKYEDEELELKIFRNEKTMHTTYDEIKTELEKEGYMCTND